MKKYFICILALIAFISGCGNEEVSYSYMTDRGTHVINTGSDYETSYRKEVGEDKPVVYIGKPLKIEMSEGHLKSLDEMIAYVDEDMIFGLREGIARIERVGDDGKILDNFEFVVTTFNDGKNADICYEKTIEDFLNSTIDYQSTVSPEYLASDINTLQDVYSYFQASGFYYNEYAPILMSGRTQWLWSLPGEAVLLSKSGGMTDIVNAAAYLLHYDFEDYGFIYTLGDGLYINNWFYEDGCFYITDYSGLLADLYHGRDREKYEPLKFTDIKAISEYYEKEANHDNTMAVIMVPSMGKTDHPPVYLSYVSDSSEIFREHVEIGFEDVIYKQMDILFSNNAFDYEVISVPTDKCPVEIPKYGSYVDLYTYE